MKTIAIIGAAGFVGSRAVEVFHLRQLATVRPVVRQFKSLARLSRFDLDCRIADALDQAAMEKAFAGCDTVVNAAMGDDRAIVGMIEPIWNACVSAGVRRLIYLSSGSVHGQTPGPETNEATPLSDKQWNGYNNAKVRAEWKLGQLRKGFSLEVVVLRPMIVFGPRSFWIWEAATQMVKGEASVINGGAGIINTIYVDNLVHAIQLSMEVPGAAGETFLVGDEETVTWREFYEPIRAHVGGKELRAVDAKPIVAGSRNIKSMVRDFPGMQSVLPMIPGRMKEAAKGALDGWGASSRPSPWRLREKPAPRLTGMMNALQQCQARLSHGKARQMLGYQAPVSFSEGMKRSLAWLDFAGFET